jgi:hypothetical protein
MKNNSILVLLLSVLGFGIMCAIVASIALTYYNGGLNTISSAISESPNSALLPGDTESSAAQSVPEPLKDTEDQSSSIVENSIESVTDLSDDMKMDYQYLTDISQKFQVCQTNMAVFQASATILETDKTLLNDETYITEINGSLDEIEANCASLGESENIPETYRKMNDELAKSDDYIKSFVENYKNYFVYKNSQYLENGNDAYAKAFEHLQTAYTLMQEALTE